MRKTKGCGSFCGLRWWWDPYKSNSSRTKPLSSSPEPCRRFPLALIRKATNNFNHAFFIAHDHSGSLYKGRIDGGSTMVAIRRLDSADHLVRVFKTQIELESQLRHPHLDSLIGYCNDEGEMILVYDYMINGTLRDHLFPEKDNDQLPWKQRLEICIGAAKGLHYLHTGGKKQIIHRDVKSINILLDEKWVAKLSDFSLSLIGPSGMPNTSVFDSPVGTKEYMDPEYLLSGDLTEKSDVFSFGVVLFEVLSCKKLVDFDRDDGQIILIDWAQDCIRNRTIDRIIDPYLKGKIAPVCLKEFVAIAQSCVRENGIERPMMGDVVEGLEFALQLQESADVANEENDSGDDEPHDEYIYGGMSFGASIASAPNDVVSR